MPLARERRCLKLRATEFVSRRWPAAMTEHGVCSLSSLIIVGGSPPLVSNESGHGFDPIHMCCCHAVLRLTITTAKPDLIQMMPYRARAGEPRHLTKGSEKNDFSKCVPTAREPRNLRKTNFSKYVPRQGRAYTPEINEFCI